MMDNDHSNYTKKTEYWTASTCQQVLSDDVVH